MTEGFEIDILPVENGERSGNAIAVRFGSPGNYEVLVYDGGTRESGQLLVDYVKMYYQSSRVDYMVSSHPDSEHASGLSVVMDQLTVGEVWMHRPWSYSPVVAGYLQHGRSTDNSLSERLKDELSAAYELEQMAAMKGIPVHEPFQGSRIGPFVVLSPEMNWYVLDLISVFDKFPEREECSTTKGTAAAVLEAGEIAADWIAERWDVETLQEDGETSAENESSVVLYGSFDGKGLLLTGDAGIKALTRTADFMAAQRIPLSRTLHVLQVPHHGSRCNVSSSVLDRIVGPLKQADDGTSTTMAFVSVSKASTIYPQKSVVNAFIRRGAHVFATKGKIIHHHHNMPRRDGWQSATPVPFSKEVEI